MENYIRVKKEFKILEDTFTVGRVLNLPDEYIRFRANNYAYTLPKEDFDEYFEVIKEEYTTYVIDKDADTLTLTCKIDKNGNIKK